MVEENMLRLELRRLRSLLSARADNVLSLEQRKLQLKTAMEDRVLEIKAHKEVLLAQSKEVNNDRSAVSKELKDRISRVDKLKNRFEILEASMISPEDGEIKSNAYYMVKAAQEREELQQQGDELDSKIKKGEKELRALENTLRLMNGRNEKFRKTLTKTDAESPEAEEKEQLQTKLRNILDKFRNKRREVEERREELKVLQQAYAEISIEEESARREVERVEAEMNALDKELAEQGIKLERATALANRTVKKHREAVGSSGESLEEYDFQLINFKDFNKKIQLDLENIAQNFPDIIPELNMLYNRAGIQPSSRQPGASTSRTGSVAGSSVSGSSHRSSVSGVSVRSTASVRRAPASQTAAEAVASHQSARGVAVTTTTLDFGLSASPITARGAASPKSSAATPRAPTSSATARPLSSVSARPLSSASARPTSARSVASSRGGKPM